MKHERNNTVKKGMMCKTLKNVVDYNGVINKDTVVEIFEVLTIKEDLYVVVKDEIGKMHRVHINEIQVLDSL